jgi:hypothetical protein
MKSKDALIGLATSSWKEKIEISLAAPIFDRVQIITYRQELTREGPRWRQVHKLCLEPQETKTVGALLEKASRVASIGAEEGKDRRRLR